MYLLLIESATDICSVAISKGEKLLAIREISDAPSQASQITLLIEAVVSAAAIRLQDLAAVCLSQGPGSYTSLRIGVSTAKGICYALDKPLIAIDTLKSLALAAAEQCNYAQDLYCPMIDARRMEAYCAVYDKHLNLVQQQDSCIIDNNFLNSFFEQNQTITFCGNASDKAKMMLNQPSATYLSLACSARNLVQLAWQKFQAADFQDIAYFEPIYAKAPNITTAKKIL